MEGLIFSLIGLILGVILMIFGFQSFRRYQKIRDIPTSKVRSIAIGTVEVQGKVRKDEDSIYKHPIDGEDTVYYERTVEKYNPDDDGSDWDTVLTEHIGDSFYVEDDTGKVRVSMEGNPTLEIEDAQTREIYRVGPDDELPRALEGTDANKDTIIPDILEGKRKYRVTVQALRPSDDVYVLGEARERDSEVRTSENEENLVIGSPDLDKEGTLNTTNQGYSWRKGFFSNINFIIANQKEEELQKEEKWQGPLGFFGGLAIATISLYYLLQILQIFGV